MIRRLIGDDVEVFVRGRGTCSVIMDRTQLEQVLINLALNARDAMPDGGVLTIDTRVVRRAQVPEAFGGVPQISFVMISVSDTGVGIGDDVREHIFEPFFTTKAGGKGTGLGLSTVYGIIKQSEGHISLESAPGSGTTFWILVPHVAEHPAEQRSTRPPASGGHETILVVDDDDSVRNLVSRILQKQGYSVVVANDAVDAISVLRQRADIGLVLTDVAMPRMSGIRLAEYLRVSARHIPVLLMSGYPNDQLRRGPSLANEGSTMLVKPFTGGELAHAVRRTLDTWEAAPM
jgi:CheY-like chemotaxis protein